MIVSNDAKGGKICTNAPKAATAAVASATCFTLSPIAFRMSWMVILAYQGRAGVITGGLAIASSWAVIATS